MRAKGVGATCAHLSKSYLTDAGKVEALKDVSAHFPAGQISAVMGPSGSGKSSLLRILAGLDRASRGSVKVGDVELTGLSRRSLRRMRRHLVGYVFQRPAENFVSYLTVGEHLEVEARGLAARNTADPYDLLHRLRLTDRAGHYPHQLSGGEQQRAAFAQVLIARPALVVADEPTAELDSGSAAELLEAISSLSESGTGVVIATHDHQVASIAGSVATIEEGVLRSPEPDDSHWMPRGTG